MSEDNVQKVKDFYGAFGNRGSSGNVDSILNLLTEDVDWEVAGPSNIIPFAGNRHGRAQVKEFFHLIEETAQLKEFNPAEFIAQGSNVVVIGHDRGTIKPTGQDYENKWVHVFTLRDGKISKFRQWYHIDVLMNAINPK